MRTERPKNNRPKMSNADRAKQFMPFAALGRLDNELAYIEKQVNIGELEHVTDWSDLSAEHVTDWSDLSAEHVTDWSDLSAEYRTTAVQNDLQADEDRYE